MLRRRCRWPAIARAGAPQIVILQMCDQHDWARRVEELGVGVAHAPGAPTCESLTAALERVVRPEVSVRAQSVVPMVRGDGARVAAERLMGIGRGEP